MKLSKIIRELNLDIVAGYNDIDKEVKGVYIGDLLSLVMARAQEEDIWITIQTHVNIVAVATLVNMSAILVAEGMNIDDETIEKANSVNVPLLRSSNTAYELACRLNKMEI